MAGESSTVVNNWVYGSQLHLRRSLLRTPLPVSTKAPSRLGWRHAQDPRDHQECELLREKPPPRSRSSFFPLALLFLHLVPSKCRMALSGCCCLGCMSELQLQRCLGNETADIVSSCSSGVHALRRRRTWESPETERSSRCCGMKVTGEEVCRTQPR